MSKDHRVESCLPLTSIPCYLSRLPVDVPRASPVVLTGVVPGLSLPPSGLLCLC